MKDNKGAAEMVDRKLEPIIIKANDEHFIVHFENEGSEGCNMRWSGAVTEIIMYNDNTWEYSSNASFDFITDLKDARIWFEFLFCWRGVWEGRIYFKDDEYWCEEMKTIPKIWKQIEVVLKNKIKSDNPNDKFNE